MPIESSKDKAPMSPSRIAEWCDRLEYDREVAQNLHRPPRPYALDELICSRELPPMVLRWFALDCAARSMHHHRFDPHACYVVEVGDLYKAILAWLDEGAPARSTFEDQLSFERSSLFAMRHARRAAIKAYKRAFLRPVAMASWEDADKAARHTALHVREDGWTSHTFWLHELCWQSARMIFWLKLHSVTSRYFLAYQEDCPVEIPENAALDWAHPISRRPKRRMSFIGVEGRTFSNG